MTTKKPTLSVMLLVAASLLSGKVTPQATVLPAAPQNAAAQALTIRVSFTEGVSNIPVSGRIIVGFSRNTSGPVKNPDLLDPQPTFAWEVRGWKPGEAIVLDARGATSWHGALADLNGWYAVQATLKTNRMARVASAPGNATTAKNVVFVEKGRMCRPLDLLFDTRFGDGDEFRESEFVKLARVPSPLLSGFYGEPQTIEAAVVLPQSYFRGPERRYPSVYVMGGWGSSHMDVLEGHPQKRYGMVGFGEEKVFVVVNGECASGYHVFCSSETNGPREESFLDELVPFIEKQYRVDRNPATRFLVGQSSGAWAGLWLLVNHPGQFGGAYAGSPDPVDFTNFTGTDIYEADANFFFDDAGRAKCFVFPQGPGGSPFRIPVEDLVGLDRIAGWGEQIYSFDAAFSRKGPDGKPLRLFDWNTGKVSPAVADSWRRHDLSLVVSGLTREATSALQGKIHIYVAEADPFKLDGSVRAFQRVVAEKGIQAEIRFVAKAGHAVWSDELRRTIHEDMDRIVRSTHGEAPAS